MLRRNECRRVAEGAARRLPRMFLAATTALLAVPAAPAAAATAPEGPTLRVRTLSFPRTLARTFTLDRAGAVATPWPATHVGFSWKGDDGTGVRYRVHRADGTASRWLRAPENHDAERGEQHFSGVLGVGRAVRIEWEVVKPPGKSIRDVTLDYMNTVDGARLETEVPVQQRSAAAAGAPDIVTRAEWGADESIKSTSGSCVRQFFPVQQLFVHHTVGRNYDSNPKATMRAIYHFHTQTQGWCDVGYNFVVGWDGTIYEGRWARKYGPWEVHSSEDRSGRAVAGAHVSGYNSGSVGISVMGNFSEVQPPPAVRKSLAHLLAWEADRHDLRPRGEHTYRNPETGQTRRLKYIAGHRDAGYTECPGNFLYAALPAIRKDTAAVMGEGKASSVMSADAEPRRVTYGESTTVGGTLTLADGAPLALQSVALYTNEADRGWTVAGTTTTGTDGSFSFSLAPQAETKAFVVYEGDDETWGSQSRQIRIRVAPEVTLVPEGAVADAFGTYHYPAGTTTARLGGTVAPPHAGKRVAVRAWEVEVDGTMTLIAKRNRRLDESGSYSVEVALPDTAPGNRYRAITWFKSDGDHASAPSPEVYFTVGV
ncbi:MAG TPA: N-acetylmuramoyl-L-alanine amidase [Actinomycetota bacterium]|nr:N-acetylmuramoyl-L-alanine amidase [Actinomycetota bacterium]